MHMTLQTMTLGYARMGKRRKIPKALESLLKNRMAATQKLQEEINAIAH